MGKLIRHKWEKIPGFRKHKCTRCNAKKIYDPGFGKIVYYDRFGNLRLHSPECVLPNTRL